jgi:amino acid adenylation domain-containing protein
MMVGILGILKAGGAYIPLDVAYPKERLAFMLQDSQTRILLTQQRFVESAPSGSLQVIRLDADWQLIASESEQDPVNVATQENLAYIIYTSGSTGKPKGTMIQHGSLVSYADTAAATYGIGPGDRVLQFCSISFDISGEEIYPCLTRGGTLVLRTVWMLDSVSVFLDTCEEWGITVVSLPTAYWLEIAAALGAEVFSLPAALRLVIIAGEKALPERLAAWHEHVGQRTRLINTYGPTEATISVTMCELTTPFSAGHGSREVSIGRAIANAQVYILDVYLEPVPIGVAGEIYIGGLLLARGYFNRPDLTGEKFIPNPFSQQHGGRLYRTGDRARFLADGKIEFLGRVDEQIKIRGYRVEPGEIEAVLSQHPAVKDVVVLPTNGISSEKRLVAYVVTNADYERPDVITSEAGLSEARMSWPGASGNTMVAAEETEADGRCLIKESVDINPSQASFTRMVAPLLRNFIRERLPDYMRPTVYVPLDALPITPNGKIDRLALPSPDNHRQDFNASYAAPRTELEAAITKVWQELLQVENVGIHDNFFDLGGHSMLMAQVRSRLREVINRDVSMVDMFKYPTIDSFVRSLNQGASEEPLSRPEKEDSLRESRKRRRQLRQTGRST